jgi:hypothetical protein
MGNFQKQTFIECDRPDKRRVSYKSRRSSSSVASIFSVPERAPLYICVFGCLTAYKSHLKKNRNLYVTYTTSKSRLLIEKKTLIQFFINLKNIRFLVEGATILLAFEGTDSSRNSTSRIRGFDSY